MFAEYVYLFIEGTQPFDSSVSSDLIAIDFTYVYLEVWKHSEKQLVFFSRKAPRHYIKVNNKKRRERKKKNFDKAISPL